DTLVPHRIFVNAAVAEFREITGMNLQMVESDIGSPDSFILRIEEQAEQLLDQLRALAHEDLVRIRSQSVRPFYLGPSGFGSQHDQPLPIERARDVLLLT